MVRATRVGADTQLAQMARLVEEAQTGKAAVQRLADRISAVFVPVVIALAVATLGFWLGPGASTPAAFTAAVAVLIIACPCALGLATPTALLVGTGRGAQLGILIRGPEVLESTRRVDTIVLDKTGTVTTGRMALSTSWPPTASPRTRSCGWPVRSKHASEHPIAPGDRRGARPSGSATCRRSPTSRNLDGLGVSGGRRRGRRRWVGRPQLLADRGDQLRGRADARGRRGRRRRAGRRWWSAGTARSAACSSSPTR